MGAYELVEGRQAVVRVLVLARRGNGRLGGEIGLHVSAAEERRVCPFVYLLLCFLGQDNNLYTTLYNPLSILFIPTLFPILLPILHLPINMDSFHEPRRVPEPVKLEDLTSEVLAREAEYRAKGLTLSGRVIHVCHYLPITATLHSSSRPGIHSPPSTPPQQPTDITPQSPSHIPDNALQPKWSLSARQGHSAMISGIRSLSATHEQVIIGWIGDIESPNTTSGMSNNPFPCVLGSLTGFLSWGQNQGSMHVPFRTGQRYSRGRDNEIHIRGR